MNCLVRPPAASGSSLCRARSVRCSCRALCVFRLLLLPSSSWLHYSNTAAAARCWRCHSATRRVVVVVPALRRAREVLRARPVPPCSRADSPGPAGPSSARCSRQSPCPTTLLRARRATTSQLLKRSRSIGRRRPVDAPHESPAGSGTQMMHTMHMPMQIIQGYLQASCKPGPVVSIIMRGAHACAHVRSENANAQRQQKGIFF